MDAGAEKLAGYFLEWQRIEDEKAKLAERSKDLFKAMKDEGYDTKAARVCFREKKLELESTASDVAEAEEAEAVLDRYRSALTNGLASRAGRARESQFYAEAKGVEREARSKVRMSESMDDTKTLSAEAAALGLIDPEAHAEMVRIADAMARKFGAGVIDPETGELTDTQGQPGEPATQSEKAASAVISPNEYAGTSSDENPAPISNPQPAASFGADTAGDVPPPSSPASSFNNPRCQHPGTCSHAHDQGSCDDCFFDWAKRPLEEQRRLWAEAMEAASETETA